MRSLLTRILLVGCLMSALAAPPAATAQTGSPFGGLPPATTSPTATDTSTTTVPTTAGNGGLARWQETLIFLAGVALILGIGFAIVGDARKAAPVSDDERRGAHQSTTSGTHKAPNKAKARQKAKAARAARKQNR